MEVFDELTDIQWPVIVSKGYRINCQTSLMLLASRTKSSGGHVESYKLLYEADQSLEVLLNGEMERIAVLDVYRYCIGE